jgi:hypothetical protein
MGVRKAVGEIKYFLRRVDQDVDQMPQKEEKGQPINQLTLVFYGAEDWT